MRAKSGICSPFSLWAAPFPSQCSSKYCTALATCSLNPSIRAIWAPRVQRALRYAPAAALVAVVVPDVLETPQGLSIALGNHALYGALAGLGWFLWRRSMIGTIIVGMLVFTLLRLYV